MSGIFFILLSLSLVLATPPLKDVNGGLVIDTPSLIQVSEKLHSIYNGLYIPNPWNICIGEAQAQDWIQELMENRYCSSFIKVKQLLI